MKRTLLHGGIALEYEYTPKRVKNINLRVRPDGTVAVSAPRWVSKGQIEDFMTQRWDWLMAVRQRNCDAAKPAFGWREGESFHLMGQSVAVEYRTGPKATACLLGDRLVLTLPDPSRAATVGEKWYGAFCSRQMELIDQKVWKLFEGKGVNRPLLRLRWMTARWGSCISQKGIITLNKRLFGFEPEVAEYVLLHEYCHLLYPNHQEDFYTLLEEFVPHRKQLDKQLKSGQCRFVR